MEAFTYQFTALRGIQAGREFYVVMCPLKLIPKIFLFDEEEIPPELRAQRTLNVPGIVGMGLALELASKEMAAEARRERAWTSQIYERLQAELGTENVVLNGHPTQRLPHNLNISLKGIESKSLVVQLKGIAISTGSACTSATVEPSHVILALGFGEQRAHSAIRLGVGRGNTDAEIDAAIGTITAGVRRVRKLTTYPTAKLV